MKVYTFLLVRFFALLLFCYACSDVAEEITAKALEDITISATDFNIEGVSRSTFNITNAGAEFAWTDNDTVGIFPDNGAQAYFPMVSGAGSKQANFTGGGWALKSASTYAAYYPFVGDFYLNKNAIPVDYTGQKQIGNASVSHIGAYDYMATSTSTPSNGKVNFQFQHLGALIQLRLLLPQPTTLNSITLTTEANSFAVKGTVDIMAEELAITAVSPDNKLTLELKDIATTENDQIVTLYLMIPPADLNGKTLKAVVKKSIGSEDVVLTAKNFEAGKAYTLSGSLKDNSGSSSGNGTYQNGVVSLATAGTMKELLGADYLDITSLKVVGPINGDDIYYLRRMAGAFTGVGGKLTSLDLSEASIVEGGNFYADYTSKYYTSNNTIGSHMFRDCVALTSIIIPDNITSFGDYAFSYCKALTSIIIPDNVTSIGTDAFKSCDALTSIIIPDNVTSIGTNAFRYCARLTSVTIGKGVTSIGTDAFRECKALTSIIIPDNVTSIGGYAFSNCDALTSVTIGKGVTSIRGSAFNNCDALTSIIIPDNVTSIGTNAFYDCDALTSVTIGKGVTSIETDAFSNCSALTSVTIGKGVTSIETDAFKSCDALTSIIIPDNVTSIGTNAFRYCARLTSVTIGKGVTSIGGGAFRECKALTSIIIPDNVTSIGEYAFESCDALTSVTIGEGLTSIENCTFYDCDALTSVTIGKGVTSIGWNAFASCNALTSIYCYATTPPNLTNDPFDFTTTRESTTLYVPIRCLSLYHSQWGDRLFKIIIEMD